MAERAISIKLSVKDQEQVLAALRAVGKEGETMAGRLEASSKKAAVEASALGKAAATTAAALGQLKSPILELTGQLGGLAPLLSQSTLLFGGVTAAVGALAAGFVILFNRAKEAAQWAEDTLKFAKALDSSVREVQALEFAARNLNVETSTFRDGMKSLQARVFEASAGMGKAKEVFKQLGIEVRDANGNVKPTLDIFKELAAVLQQFDRADRLTIMRRVFGGTELAPLLKDGPEGLRMMIENAERLGVVMDEGPLKAAAETNKQIREIENLTSTKLRNAFAEISPVILGIKIIAHEVLTYIVKMVEVMFQITGISDGFREMVRRAQLGEIGRLDEDIAAKKKGGLGEFSLDSLGSIARGDPNAAVRKYTEELEELQRRRAALLKKIEADTKRGEKYDGPPEVTRRLADPEALKKGVAAHEQALKEIEKLENEAARKATDDRFQRIDVQSAQEIEKFQKLLADKVIGEQEYARVSEAIWKKNQAAKDEISRVAIDKWVDDQVKAHERAAEEAMKPWRKFGDDLASELADSIQNGFKVDRANIERSIFRLAGGTANTQLFNPLLSGLGLATPLAGSESSPLFNLGRSFSAGATVFGQPIFGGLSGSAVEQDVVTRAAISAGQPIPGGQGLLQGALGGAATGFSIGSIIPSLFPGTFNGQNSQIGGTIGGGIGAAVGSIIPGIGTMIGGLVGSTFGSIFGGLFGPKKPSVGPNSGANLAMDAEGRAIVGSAGADNGGDVAQGRAFAAATAEAINRLTKETGATLTAIGGFQARIFGNRFELGFGTGVSASGSDAEAVIKQGLYSLIKRGDIFDFGSGPAAQAASRSTAADLEGLLSDIEFGKNLADIMDGLEATEDQLKAVEVAARKAAEEQVKAITGFVDKAKALGFDSEAGTALTKLVDQLLDFSAAPEQITETAKALAALAANFEVLRDNAEALGLTEARIAAAEAEAKDELRKGFDEGIARQLLAITDPLAAALADFDKLATQRLEEARQAGADMVAVERLNAAQRLAVLEQASGASVSSLKKFYEDVLFGPTGGASPGQALGGSQAAFQAAVAQASAGDGAARGRLAELGQGFLESSRAFFGSSAGFQQDRQSVLDALAPFVGLNDNPIVAAVNESSAEGLRVWNKILDELAALRATTVEQAADIASLNARQARAA